MTIKLNFSASGVSAFNCQAIYGMPSLNAFFGLIEKMEIKSSGAIKWVRNEGVLVIINDYYADAVSNYNTTTFGLRRSSQRMGSAQLDTPELSFLEVTLIFEIETKAEDYLEQIEILIEASVFASGMIEKIDVKKFDNFDVAIKKAKAGVIIREPRDIYDDDVDGLENFFKHLSSHRIGEGIGKLSVAHKGYRLLEEPVIKSGARDDKKHAFAEALIGLVEYKTSKRAVREDAWVVIRDGPNRVIRFKTIQQINKKKDGNNGKN